MSTLSPLVADMSARAFGLAIETVGVTRATLAAAIAKAIEGVVTKADDRFKSYYVTCPNGRKWRIMGTATSLAEANARGWTDKAGEIVSPILTLADMDHAQTVIRAARKAGARIDASCSVRVQVDARDFDAAAVGRVVADVCNHDEMLDRGLAIEERRRDSLCKRLPTELRDALIAAAAAAPAGSSVNVLAPVWYGGDEAAAVHGRTNHYHESRRHGLNLHSLYYRGTVEFTHFNGTLHAGEVKAYVMLALGFMSRAKTARRINLGSGWAREGATLPTKAVSHFFYDHGLTGEQHAETRRHLTQRITGAVVAPDAELAPLARRRPLPAPAAR